MHQHHTSEVAVHKRGTVFAHKHTVTTTVDVVVFCIKTPECKKQPKIELTWWEMVSQLFNYQWSG